MLVALETVPPFFTADRTDFGESRAHGFYPEGKRRRQARVTNRTRPKVLGVDFVTTHSSSKKSWVLAMSDSKHFLVIGVVAVRPVGQAMILRPASFDGPGYGKLDHCGYPAGVKTSGRKR